MADFRKKQLWQLIFTLTILSVTLFPTACVIAAETKAEPTPGGELIVSLYETPSHLNPAIQSGMATAFPGAQLFAGLLRFDENWQPHPYLAEKWEIAKDGLTVTLHLVNNATFHDGQPVTSADVAFSIMTVKEFHPFKSMLAPVEHVETPDVHTVVIRLEKPHPAILLAMSPALLPILPQHVYGNVKDVKGHPANIKPIGSGPFKLESFTPGQEIRLIKNDDFFMKGRPFLDRLTIKFIRNTMEEDLGMETGDIDMMVSIQDLREVNHLRTLEEQITIEKTAFKGIGPMYWLAFNLRQKPFNDLRVRQALAYTIDRKFVVDTLFRGETTVETGPISSDSPFYSDDVNHYQQDFDKANRLLDEAGYGRDEKGMRFSFRLSYIPGKSGVSRDVPEYFRELFLRNLGVEVIIENPENLLAWIKQVANWEFEATMDTVFNWGDPVIGVHRTYLSSNIRKGVIWSNTQGYSNPEVDELLARAGEEFDFQKRYDLYKRFQQIIVDELPVLPIYRPMFALAYNNNIGWQEASIWGLMSPLDTVYWKNKKQ